MLGKDKILYDTDIIIDFLKGNIKAKEILTKNNERRFISVITVCEIYAGMRSGEEHAIQSLINYFEVVELDKEIARLGGLYKQQYFKSHNVTLPDALIAASVTHYKMILKTLNIKHYPMIKGLIPAYKKE